MDPSFVAGPGACDGATLITPLMAGVRRTDPMLDASSHSRRRTFVHATFPRGVESLTAPPA
jgi:hypothetical protein